MAQSYFTITACIRCRKRKARCDAGIPACVNCDSSGSTCEYTDPFTKEKRPRAHLVELERQASDAEDSIRRLKQNRATSAARVDQEHEQEPTQHAGFRDKGDSQPELIHFESGGDGHFLGSSSGLHIARSVLQSTRKDSDGFDNQIAEQPDHRAPSLPVPVVEPEALEGPQEIPLPPWDTVEGLLEVFFREFEITYPILVQEEFVNEIEQIYSSNYSATKEDSRTQFMLDTVLSISYHLVSQDSLELAALAEKYLVRASSQLGDVVGERDHRTLQCLLLLLLSSMLNPKSAPMWYISGICMRMCVDLGYHSESTISHGTGTSSVKADTKRRLFWVTYYFDRSLAIMLGRPFFIDDDRLEVELKVGDHASQIQAQSLHWLKMKRMESKIASHLQSLQKDAASIPDGTSADLDTEIDHWLEEAMSIVPEGITNMEIWENAHANAKLMLHRPLLIGAAWSDRSLIKSYEAALKLIHLTFIRVQKGLLELTWLDLHSHLISGLTLLLLVLRSAEIRTIVRKDWVHFKSSVFEWQISSERLATRWNSVARMKRVLNRLAEETLDNIQESATTTSHGGNSSFKRSRAGKHASRLKENDFLQEYPHAPSSLEPTARIQVSGDQSTHHEAQGLSAFSQSSALDRPVENVMYGQNIQNYTPQTDQTSQGTTSLFDNLDFPSILGGDFWTELGQFDIPLQPHFIPFTNDQSFSDPSGLPAWQVNGRLDSALTDSVLNFQGAFDGDDSSM